MPPAARATDMHQCPKVEPGPAPHLGGPLLMGEPTVLIGHLPAVRWGDQAICLGPPDKVTAGSSTVLIGHQPAARLGDATEHGGVIMIGCPTVHIGDSPQGAALLAARGALVEVCDDQGKGGGGDTV